MSTTKDIVNWQLYKDPTAMIPYSEYARLYREEKKLQPKDILYVRRRSYRIGSVAMISPYDIDVILIREILVLRLVDSNNKYNLTLVSKAKALKDKIPEKVYMALMNTDIKAINSKYYLANGSEV